MERIVITGPDDLADGERWDKEPVFDFATEADALRTFELLGEDLRAAREQARQVMRYMTAAVLAAKTMNEAERPTAQGIIGHSKLARQTVYNILGEG